MSSTEAAAGAAEQQLMALMERAVSDLSAAASIPLMVVGERLGLYRAMAGAGPLTAAELAERAGVGERYAREWLANQAAGGYVEHHDDDRYELPAAFVPALADESSEAYLLGATDVIAAMYADAARIEERFRDGEGMGWHEHDPRLFRGTERFFRPGYKAHLVAEWIPALEGVEEKLRAGAQVADVGCGHGASTVLMAEAFPASRFTGFDYHEASIARAREAASAAGVADRTAFEVASAQGFPGRGYDLVAMFDCLHDMGDPLGAARHVREALAGDGTFLLVEPFAGDRVADNLHPVGRMFYAASTFICCPSAMSQDGGYALGAQAGEARLVEVLTDAGFSRVRRAAATPFNLVLEARP